MANGYLKSLLKKLKLNESTISMFLGLLVVVVIGMLVFNYFKSVNLPTEEEKEELSLSETTEIKLSDLPTIYVVKEGDNLWEIAESIYGSGYNWVDIAAESKLVDPDGLAIGQELTIPKTEAKPMTVQIDKPAGETITDSQYTIIKGDHLWAIAVRAYGDGYRWVEIARENNITNPNLIHPGNILSLPR